MAEEKGENRRLTRRKALKKIAGTAGAAVALPILNSAAPPHAAKAKNPPAFAPAAYAPKCFSSDQMETIAALADQIIPADEHSPGARAARVHEYIDVIIAESGQNRKGSWVAGLDAIDRMSERLWGKRFAECAEKDQVELLTKIGEHENQPTTREEHFFVAIKNATIEGYYTSEIGIHQELEYQGNTAMAEFEGCVHSQHNKAKE